MIKLVGIAVVALILTTLLKKINPIFSIFITVCASVIILVMISNDISSVLSIFNEIINKINNDNTYIKALLKMLGISLLSQFVVNICNDCGESALASQVELASKIIIIITVLPIFETIINIVTGLLK